MDLLQKIIDNHLPEALFIISGVILSGYLSIKFLQERIINAELERELQEFKNFVAENYSDTGKTLNK